MNEEETRKIESTGQVKFVNKVEGPEAKEVAERLLSLMQHHTSDLLACQGYTERLLLKIYQQFPITPGSSQRHYVYLDDAGLIVIVLFYKGRSWEVLVSH